MRRENLFGISTGMTYEARLKGSDGQCLDKYTGLITGFKRIGRGRYNVLTIEDGQGPGVATQEYPLEAILTGRSGSLELDLDIPIPSVQVGAKGTVVAGKLSEEAKAVKSNRDDLGGYRVECIAHNPPGTQQIAETVAGPVFRVPLVGVTGKCSATAEIPQTVEDLTKRRNRRALRATMHWNSAKGPVTLGKPNSAFLLQKGERLYIDYLLESPEFAREEAPKLHNLMREQIDYIGGVDPFAPNLNVLSGHVAVLPVTTADVKYVLLLDKFEDRDAYDQMDVPTKTLMNRLYAARVVPLTTNGFIIRFGQTNQRQAAQVA